MPSATVTATAHGVVPRPGEMPAGAQLTRASFAIAGFTTHVAGPGFWWMGHGVHAESLRIAAPFEAGAQVTLFWE